MKYDFSMLDVPYGKHLKRAAATFVILSATVIGFTPLKNSSVAESTEEYVALVIFASYTFWLVAVALIAAWVYFARKNAVRKFVDTYGLKTTVDPKSLLPAAISGPESSTDIYVAYSFPIQDSADHADVIECCRSSENSRRDSTKDYTVAAFKSKHKLPHLFIDAKANGITHRYSKDQRIQLEGDFNKYFSLYVPEMADVEALQILAPNVMQLLIDSGKDYDIEINGTLVTVFSEGRLFNHKDLPNLLAFAETMHASLAHKSVRWQVVEAVAQGVTYGEKATNLQHSLFHRYGRHAFAVIGWAAALAGLFFIMSE